MPFRENPRTARIVRIKYAEPSYARLVGSDGREVKRELFQEKKNPENLIVLSVEDRENRNALDATVEVGLKHELLSSGIELIDTTGKSESDVLDRVSIARRPRERHSTTVCVRDRWKQAPKILGEF